jgi:dolichol-phosphate mannosyltransferase
MTICGQSDRRRKAGHRHLPINHYQPMPNRPFVSIIIPTLEEAANLPLLVRRIAAAMAGRPYEIVIVDDDSRDGTADVCAALARDFPLSLHVRARSADGLGGAVLAGFWLSRGEVLVVMDADLQHPPEALPALLAPIDSGDADFVLGSRHAPGGTVAGRWGAWRRLNSRVATLLARPFADRACTDPMSGFFALTRETLDAADSPAPLGYKIGLELMCKCRARRVREVPIHFGARAAGRSKLTPAQQFKYLEHLSRLYDFTFPRLSPAVKFVVATGVAWLSGLGLFLALSRTGVVPMPAATLSYPAALLATAVFHLRYVRTQREFLVSRRPWRDFLVTCLCEWAACAATATWIANRVRDIHALEVFALTYAAATFTRYVLRKELMQDVRGLRAQPRVAETNLTRSREAQPVSRRAA